MMARLLRSVGVGVPSAAAAGWLLTRTLPPASFTAWLGLVVAVVLAGVAAVFLRRSFHAFGDVVFGQRATGSEPVTWRPGSGTHGGQGGQQVPYVPYNPDWDHERRIK
ncbi:hypothetical protein [Egicoccus sp. AB-alg2]|uniref:hypothetical protein n=1 Tax=Egicoccus sp. AB-alg2 TaxID=3242693 RepID=UPI00359ECDE7